MPIHQIRKYAELAWLGPGTIPARKQILEDHRLSVIRQIEELQQNLKAVDFKIGLYGEGWVPEVENDPQLLALRNLCTPTPNNSHPQKDNQQ